MAINPFNTPTQAAPKANPFDSTPVGVAVNTIKGIPAAAYNGVKNIVSSFLPEVGVADDALVHAITTSSLQPLKDYFSNYPQRHEQYVQQTFPQSGDTPEQFKQKSINIALGAVGGEGGGGGVVPNAARTIAHSAKPTEIASVIRETFPYLKERADELGHALANVTNPSHVEAILKSENETAIAQHVKTAHETATKKAADASQNIAPQGNAFDRIPTGDTAAEPAIPNEWAGTGSLKQSTAGDTSISSAPTERGDVSVPKTDTSVPFEPKKLAGDNPSPFFHEHDWRLETRSVDSLKPNERNFDHMPKDDALIGDYAEAIKRGDKMPPIMVDESGKVIDGNNRLEAYQRAGIKDVQVLVSKGKGTGQVDRLYSSLDKKALAKQIEKDFKVPGAYAEQVAGMAHEVKAAGGDEAAVRETIINNVKDVPGAKLPNEGGTPTGDHPFEQSVFEDLSPEAVAAWEQTYRPRFQQAFDEVQNARRSAENARGEGAKLATSRRYDSALKRLTKPFDDFEKQYGAAADQALSDQERAFLRQSRASNRAGSAARTSRTPNLRGRGSDIRGSRPRQIGEILANRERSLRPGDRSGTSRGTSYRGTASTHGGDEAYRALSNSIRQNVKSVRTKVHILDYMTTPEYTLERMGLGNEAKDLRTAFENYQKELPKEIDRITQWFNEVKDIKDAPRRIFKWLDGQNQTLTEAESEVAHEMKAYLKQWADRLNLPEDKRIASYITHIFEQDFIEKEFDPDLAKIIADKVPGSVYDPFLEKRIGAGGFKEDAFAALDAYVKRAVRKANMDPALEGLEKAADKLDIESYKYIQRYASRINMRPTETENLLDNLVKNVVGYKFGQRPVAYLSRQARQIIYRGTLGLNVGSALKNLTQGVNTYAKLGEKYTIIGYSKLGTRLLSGNLADLYETNVLSEDLVQDRAIGVYKQNIQKIDKGLFALFELAEKINRGSAFYGAKAKALDSGKTEQEAIDYAKRIVRETQFSFSSIDTPVAMNDDVVKLLTQLQSFNIKQTEFLGKMVANKEWAGLVRWIGGSLTMVYTVGQLFGMKPTDIIPTARLGGAPIPTAVGAGVNYVTARNQQDKSDAQNQLVSSALTVIPAGVQMHKTAQGIQDLSQGKETTPTGRTRFEVPSDFWTALRALLFGPHNLPQAQDYYAKLDAKASGAKKTTANPFDN